MTNMLSNFKDPIIVKSLGFGFILLGQTVKIIISKGKYLLDPFTYGIFAMFFGSLYSFITKSNTRNILFFSMSWFIISKMMSQIVLKQFEINKIKENDVMDEEYKFKKYLIPNILKFLGFFIITIGAWIEVGKSTHIDLLSDPFPIGVSVMALTMLGYLFSMGKMHSGWTYQAMNFFILTKFMSHVTHAGHKKLNIWGIKHKETLSAPVTPKNQITATKNIQSGGNVFIGYNNLI